MDIELDQYEVAKIKDEILSRENPWLDDLPPLEKCNCGGEPLIDVSMALIQCPRCGLSTEYRYNRGVIPYHTWQLNQTKRRSQ